MAEFRGFRIHAEKDNFRAGIEKLTLEDLTPGDVVIATQYASVNYKDALAGTGRGRILRRSPLVGGIDLAGKVVSSEDSRFGEGDPVVVCGCDLSETRDGGYAEFARVAADTVVKLPDGLSLKDTMAIGTAGFTAALAVHRMEENHQTPALGPIVVTGATGGVGSFAIDMLASRGYEVHALTGKREAEAYLRSLGVSEIIDRKQLDTGKRPLEKAMWGGAVDNLGGEVLVWLTRTMNVNGNIAAIGLAASHELNTTVMPFILRGVNLLGINSSQAVSPTLRDELWQRLASDLKPAHLDQIVTDTVTLEQLLEVFERFIAGQVTGRIVVNVGG